MTTNHHLNAELARERIADLLRAAATDLATAGAGD